MTILQYSGGDQERAGRGGRGRGHRGAAATSSGFPVARKTNKWKRSTFQPPSSSSSSAFSAAATAVATATKKGNRSWKRVDEKKAALPTEPKEAPEVGLLLFVDDASTTSTTLQPDARDASAAAVAADEADEATKGKKGPILKGPSNFNPNSNRIKHSLSMSLPEYDTVNVNYSKKGKRIRLVQTNSNEDSISDRKPESEPPHEAPTSTNNTTAKKSGGQPPLLTDCAYRTTSTATGLVRVPPPANARVCAKFARGLDCTNPHCRDRHDLPHPECALPYCYYFQRQGMCLRTDCPFRHIKVNPRATLCPSFVALGYCPDTECAMKHETTTAAVSKTKLPPQQQEAFHNHSRGDAAHKKMKKKKTPNMSWRKTA